MEKVAVLILLGQSNATGHAVPMKEEDRIITPLKNVFGLKREHNQFFDTKELLFTGYTGDMNLGEEQDHTYSVANCLASLWQKEKDEGVALPDLYIVHISVGAQGTMGEYMWNPDRPEKLIPGELGVVDISLYPFTVHILSLLKEYFEKTGKSPDYMLHWRGGENDIRFDDSILVRGLKNNYERIFGGFYQALGGRVPTVLHRIVCNGRTFLQDPEGNFFRRMNFIDLVFEQLRDDNDNISIFDVRRAPNFDPRLEQNGIFIEDLVHYTPETNNWVAAEILNKYVTDNLN